MNNSLIHHSPFAPVAPQRRVVPQECEAAIHGSASAHKVRDPPLRLEGCEGPIPSQGCIHSDERDLPKRNLPLRMNIERSERMARPTAKSLVPGISHRRVVRKADPLQVPPRVGDLEPQVVLPSAILRMAKNRVQAGLLPSKNVGIIKSSIPGMEPNLEAVFPERLDAY